MFEQKEEKECPEFSVDILMDASSSRKKQQEFISAQACVLTKALRACQIPFQISSYCSIRGFTVMRIFKEYEKKQREEELFHYVSAGNNRDGLALRAAGYLMEKSQKEKKLLLVLTDASPQDDQEIGEGVFYKNNEYMDEIAVLDTEKEVHALRQKGIEVIGIFTGGSREMETAQRIFGRDWIKIQDMNQFSEAVGKILRQKLYERGGVLDESIYGNELLWLFLIYSFLGWVLETVIATVRQRKVVNRGLINGPFCIIYGIGAVLITIWLQELSGLWLFLFSAVYASVVEWIAGHLIQKIYHERWWDYSDIKWNLDGYICLPFSIIWGALGYVIVKWSNRLLLDFLNICPEFLIHFILLILIGALAFDALASYILLRGTSEKLEKWEEANNRFVSISAKIAKWITVHVQSRIHKAYPKAVKAEAVTAQ